MQMKLSVEEANANAGINVSQWDKEAMPQNTNKLAYFFARISLLPVFTHTFPNNILVRGLDKCSENEWQGRT